MADMHVKKGDQVQVMTGENVGRAGKILSVDRAKQRVIVDGINIIKKHTKPSRTNPQGGIVERPGPIHVSNVLLVCPNCNKAARAGKQTAQGEKVRICRKCGKAID